MRYSNSKSAIKHKLTAEKHFLQQRVDVRHTEQLGELDLFDHLPRDGLQRGQQQQDLTEPATAENKLQYKKHFNYCEQT